jgi:hypothetical protein
MAPAKNGVGKRKYRAVKKDTPPSTTQTPQNSLLLSLPGEIRNAIYKLLLVSYKTVEPRGPWKLKSPSYPSYPFSQYRSALAIAFTCKQLKDEVLSLYYGTNNFKFGPVEEMRKCLEAIGNDGRELLTHVEFNYWGHARAPGFRALANLPNLQRLHININMDTLPHWRTDDLFRVGGLKQLKAIRGCKEVEVVCDMESFSVPAWKNFADAYVEKFGKFEEMLRKELCKPRGTK